MGMRGWTSLVAVPLIYLGAFDIPPGYIVFFGGVTLLHSMECLAPHCMVRPVECDPGSFTVI